MCFSPQRRTIIRQQNVQKCSEDYSFLTFWLPNVLFATAADNYSTAERPKVLRRLQFFNILTSKCVFRHSRVHFFDWWRAKSASKLMCFVHFHLKICFSPQQRAIFRHLNFKKCSETVSFLAFSLQNLLFATAACNFSTSELPKVLRDRQFFSIFTSKSAFRHSSVQFFDIWTSKSGPKLTCFVHFDLQMCFSPQRRAIFDFSSEHRPPHPPL